jgi:hypothetical protein
VPDMNFNKTPATEGKIQPKVTFFFMYVLLVTYRSQPHLHIWWRVWLQRRLCILRNIPQLQTEVPAENSLLFQQIALNMWLITTTITLFITKLRLMADEYSGTILHRQPTYSLQVTQLFK